MCNATDFKLNSRFVVEVDGQTMESWSNVVSKFSDSSIYQSWAYGAEHWSESQLSHMVLREDGKLVAAAQLRIVRVPFVPAGIAYLRWGPLCQLPNQDLRFDVVKAMTAGLKDEYCKRRGLTLEILPNVYPGTGEGCVFKQALDSSLFKDQSLGLQYRTILVNLDSPLEEIKARFDKKTRRHLKRAEKNELVIDVSDTTEAYDEFVGLYEPMLERKQFETPVDVREFGRMQGRLTGNARMRVFTARKDGEAIGALVCSLNGNTGIYLLGATNLVARDLLASYLLHWQVIVWLKDNGARWYDLGGIDPLRNKGGFEFKSGFGGVDVTQLPAHSCDGNLLSRAVSTYAHWRRRRISEVQEPEVAGLRESNPTAEATEESRPV